MESISGLPTHVLAVHAPVVLMPLTLLITLVLAVKPTWRRRSGFLLSGAAVVVFGASYLALLSGRAFEDVVGDRVDTDDHESLANTTLILVGCFLVATIALAIVDRWRERGGPGWLAPATLVSLIATIVLAGLSTLWMVRTGDEGARLVWDGVIETDDS